MSKITREFSDLIERLLKMSGEMIIFDKFLADDNATELSEEKRSKFIGMAASNDGGRSLLGLLPTYLHLQSRSRRATAAAWLEIWLQQAQSPFDLTLESFRTLVDEFRNSENSEYLKWFEIEPDENDVERQLVLENAIDTLRTFEWVATPKYNWDPREGVENNGIAHASDQLKNALDHAFLFADEYIFSVARQQFVEFYIEDNPYYADLYSRLRTGSSEQDVFVRLEILTAKDFDLLHIPDGYLDDIETTLYEDCYEQSREYFLRTKYNPVYADNTSGQRQSEDAPTGKTFERFSYYRAFARLMIMIDTLNTFLFKNRVNVKHRPDSMSSVDLDHKLVIYYLQRPLADVPDLIKREVLKTIEKLFQLKGTDRALEIVASLFATTNIILSRYDLVKKTQIDQNGLIRATLEFLRMPLDRDHIERVAQNEDGTIDFESFVDYDDFVSRDPEWMATKNQILSLPFGSISTKYISLETRVRLHEDVFRTSMFLNLLLYKRDDDGLVFDWSRDGLRGIVPEIDVHDHEIPALLMGSIYALSKIWNIDRLLSTSASDRFFMARFDRLRNIQNLIGLTGEQLEAELETQSLSFRDWEYALKPLLIEARWRALNSLGTTDSRPRTSVAWDPRVFPSDQQLRDFIEFPYVDEDDNDWSRLFLSLPQDLNHAISVPAIGFDSLMRSLYFFDRVASEWSSDPEANWRYHREFIQSQNLDDADTAMRFILSGRMTNIIRDFRESLLRSQIELNDPSNNPWAHWREQPSTQRVPITGAGDEDKVSRYSSLNALTVREYLAENDQNLLDYIEQEPYDRDVLRERVIVMTRAIESFLQSDTLAWRDAGNPLRPSISGSVDPRLEFLRKVVLTLARRFKAYTIKLIDLGDRIIINDPGTVTIRPQDDPDDSLRDSIPDRVMITDRPIVWCERAARLLTSFENWWTFETAMQPNLNVGAGAPELNLNDPNNWTNKTQVVFTGVSRYLQYTSVSDDSDNTDRPRVDGSSRYFSDTARDKIVLGMWVAPDDHDFTRLIVGNAPADISVPVFNIDDHPTIQIDEIEYTTAKAVASVKNQPFVRFAPDDWYLVVVQFSRTASPRVWLNTHELIRDDQAQASLGWKITSSGFEMTIGAHRVNIDEVGPTPAYSGAISNVFMIDRELTQFEHRTLFQGRWRIDSTGCLPTHVTSGDITIAPSSHDFGSEIIQ